MAEYTENFFEDNLFRFENEHCECVTDTINIAPGRPPQKAIKVQAIPDNKIQFAFSAGVGLVRLGEKGTLIEKNLLGSLISIKTGDLDSLFEYFNRNGFLFNISSDEYEPIETDKMFELIRRLRTTVELLSELGAIKKDYQKILGLSLYLILSDPIEIKFSSFPVPYKTCMHSLLSLLRNAHIYSEPEYFRDYIFQGDDIPIPDTIYKDNYQLDFQLYNECLEGSGQEYILKGSSSDFFQSVFFLYAYAHEISPKMRHAIDLLFHYCHDVGIVKSVEDGGQLVYFDKPQTDKITPIMKNLIIELAHEVISEEINANMSGIHPLYDAEKMSPSWHIDSLISGLYFSIFYMKPDLELFRKCRQCGQYFSVKATSTRKVYCSDSCRNNYQQSMHRKRKREKAENLQ